MAAPASHSPGTPGAAPDIITSHSDGAPGSISAARTPHSADNETSSRTIGQPITFSSGLFAGRTVRAELREIQKAAAGRKYVWRPSTFFGIHVDILFGTGSMRRIEG
jgi:hypothetical protein